jgi:protein-S-isoprenylcysteine O-methyltransferase Ste14
MLAATITHLLTPGQTITIFVSEILSVLLMLSGFAIMITAWWHFKTQSIAICPTEPTASLITSGIYRLTRNPMYLGLAIMLVGIALWMGTLPYYAAAAGFFLIIHSNFCPYEEAKLQRTFGNEYDQYKSRVRQWI